jgi:hypothetical protein
MQLKDIEPSLSVKQIKNLLEPYHPDSDLYQPRLEDFPDIHAWQKAYDQWYKHQTPRNCQNFAGHF